MEICDHRHLGGGCETTSPHVVMATHPTTPEDGEALQRALQDKDHQQKAKRGAAQAAGGGTEGGWV